MPRFYIGSTSYKKHLEGYHGTVTSKLYKSIWKEELKEHKDLFHSEILSFHKTREEALIAELKLHLEFNVKQNNNFINMSNATPNGFFGRDVSGSKNPRFGKGELTSGKKNGMYGVHRHGDKSLGLTGKDHPCFGRTGEKHPMFGKRGTLNPNTGKTWVNNGVKRKFVLPTIAKELINNGWVKGYNLS